MTITHIVAARLTDRRVQVWASKSEGSAWSLWKTGLDSDSSWTQWPTFDGAPPNLVDIAAERLSDGRIQLWAAQPSGCSVLHLEDDQPPGRGVAALAAVHPALVAARQVGPGGTGRSPLRSTGPVGAKISASREM